MKAYMMNHSALLNGLLINLLVILITVSLVDFYHLSKRSMKNAYGAFSNSYDQYVADYTKCVAFNPIAYGVPL
jgi:ATP/ADP translocase